MVLFLRPTYSIVFGFLLFRPLALGRSTGSVYTLTLFRGSPYERGQGGKQGPRQYLAGERHTSLRRRRRIEELAEK